MCASDNLVLVLKTKADGKGHEKYCLSYEDSKIIKRGWNIVNYNIVKV
jgi:hypothetical protein